MRTNLRMLRRCAQWRKLRFGQAMFHKAGCRVDSRVNFQPEVVMSWPEVFLSVFSALLLYYEVMLLGGHTSFRALDWSMPVPLFWGRKKLRPWPRWWWTRQKTCPRSVSATLPKVTAFTTLIIFWMTLTNYVIKENTCITLEKQERSVEIDNWFNWLYLKGITTTTTITILSHWFCRYCSHWFCRHYTTSHSWFLPWW